MAEHHQQRGLTSKNPGREDDDPNQNKKGKVDRPYVAKKTHNILTKQALSFGILKVNETVVGRKTIGENQPKKNCGK